VIPFASKVPPYPPAECWFIKPAWQRQRSRY
jgi:hypothetical protein